MDLLCFNNVFVNRGGVDKITLSYCGTLFAAHVGLSGQERLCTLGLHSLPRLYMGRKEYAPSLFAAVGRKECIHALFAACTQ